MGTSQRRRRILSWWVVEPAYGTLLLAVLLGWSGCAVAPLPERPESRGVSDFRLREFSDEAALGAYLEKFVALESERRNYEIQRWKERLRFRPSWESESSVQEVLVSGNIDLAASTPSLSATGFAASEEASITNVQEAGVDEGDIVKKIGRYVVVLRRGRLFSFDIGERPGSPLRLVDRVDVPATLPEDGEEMDAWYDELLVRGSTLVVIGFNYGLDATEIVLFELSPLGRFLRRDTIYLTSFDYYDTSNYASRIVAGDLILYAPVYVKTSFRRDSHDRIWPEGASPDWPRRLRFSETGELEASEPLIFDLRVYAGYQSPGSQAIIHTMLRCPLDEAEFRCSATGVLGPWRETHYISRSAFYLWLGFGGWMIDVERLSPGEYRKLLEDSRSSLGSDPPKSVIYRLPLDASWEEFEVGAVEVRGHPNDQFSFRERAETLDAFATAHRRTSEADTAEKIEHYGLLIEIPLEDFKLELQPWSQVDRQELPIDSSWCVLNRFIGGHLVYAACGSLGNQSNEIVRLRVKAIAEGAALTEIELEGAPERIESLGDAALIAGFEGESRHSPSASDFWLKTLELDHSPALVDSLVIDSRSAAEFRSHAFNFSAFGEERIAALPIARVEGAEDWDEVLPAPTEIQYFGIRPDLALYAMGELSQSVDALGIDDACRASCVDWYGAARPFFVGRRIFGLIDYELIEGGVHGGRVFEIDRVSAMPR